MTTARWFVAVLLLGAASALAACDSSPSDSPSPAAEACEVIDPEVVTAVMGDDDYVARVDGALQPRATSAGIHCSIRSRSAPNSSIRVSIYQVSTGVDAEMARLKESLVDEGDCSLAASGVEGDIVCHYEQLGTESEAPGVQLISEQGDSVVQASIFRWSESSPQDRDDAAGQLRQYAGDQLTAALDQP